MTTAPRRRADAVAGVLLAGGLGRRAGVDKRYLVLGGHTLAQRNLAFLRRRFQRVVVSLAPGQRLDLGDGDGAEVLHDDWPGASPLAGIATALERLRRPVFAMAVDWAFPDDGALRRVLAAAPGHDVAVPAIGVHYEPLFAVYGPGCLPVMTSLLRAGEHSILEVYPRVDTARVRFADESLFRNINTMDEFERARREAAAQTDDAPGAPALVAIVAKSNTGKTTFIEKLIPELLKLGLRVGTVKHDAHSFEIDHPGKDSWRHGQAGAHAYVVSSREKLAYIARMEGEMPLTEIARRFFADFDLVVAEGYKRTAPHCVEIFRTAAGHAEPLCAPGEAMALVTDAPLEHEHRFALDDAAGVARFLAVRLDALRRY
jgi:molybdopterin-guanine dinucleotide biosynthesis protein B/molybdopterin-guanine dinucleotide biosynthesis protein